MLSRHLVFKIAVVLTFIGLLPGCKTDEPKTKEKMKEQSAVNVPDFNANNAYAHVAKQVAFGPRVPNSVGHDSCAAWLVRQFKEFKAEVIVQEANLKAYTGETLRAKNIIASYNVQNANRVLLCAHWDTRHIADYDPDPANRNKPILGADDAGSGVGVLLEIARVLGENPISIGVDIVLFDAEDHGQPESVKQEDYKTEWWCLGSQHWSKNPHKPGYRARYGILLDMVGSKGAKFSKEGVSMQYAYNIVEVVWNEAARLGFGNYFDPNPTQRQIIDDHYFVNTITRIPTIDIINLANTKTGFGEHWHTQKDDMSVIDKGTLKAVGQTLLSVLYKDAAGVL